MQEPRAGAGVGSCGVSAGLCRMLLCQETSGPASGMCHLQEAVHQLLTSPCFAWLGSTLFSSTLPEAVQTVEWAG